MKTFNFIVTLTFIIVFSLLLSSCKKENATEPTELTDEQFIQQIIENGFNTSGNDEDNLMSQEKQELDDGGAVKDDDNIPMTPIDSLLRWGRKITNVSINVQITGNDSIKNVAVTRNITGNYIIIGLKNGLIDSITKPYTAVYNRNIVFKRINRTPYPRLNWRVYQISNSDGQTTSPQIGSTQVQITKIEIYKNNSSTPTYTINGPDFQNQFYTTMFFGGTGITTLNRGDQILVKVYTISQQVTIDYVAYHWARNTFGFHRIPFTLESQNGNNRVYSKTFTIYTQHRLGVFNGYISASTRESLYDDDINKFASDQVGIPYKIVQ